MATLVQSTVPSKRPPPSSSTGSDEDKSVSPADLEKQDSKSEHDSTTKEDKYTRPPRVSFGVELEFLVFRLKGGADKENVPGLADISRSPTSSRERIAQMLRAHGLKARSTSEEEETSTPGSPMWLVTEDSSIEDVEDDADITLEHHVWDGVEINSPPLYACDEAFQLLSAVIRLVTTNFRVRVNQTCGLHIHVGNGPHHLDMRALRNYAALLWATDDVLSTLHSPDRSVNHFCKPVRRVEYTNLSTGWDAEVAYHEVVAAKSWIPRYLARARKLGEAPVVSRQKLRRRIEDMENARANDQETEGLEPECSSDESDWEMQGSKPFFRPKKSAAIPRQQTRKIPARELLLSSREEEERLDAESITRELPPQLTFNMPNPGPPPATHPRSTSTPFLKEKRPRRKPMPIEQILEDEKIKDRCGALAGRPAAYLWRLTWRGVRELLASDIGVHQLALLMCWTTPGDVPRYASSNWSSVSSTALSPDNIDSKLKRRTIECRFAAGSMDADWVVTWAKIQCRLLEWARDAEPSTFMRVLCKLSRDDHSDECTYDVLDLLRDLGMFTEVKLCEKRLERDEEAWYECMLFRHYEEEEEEDNDDEEDLYGPG